MPLSMMNRDAVDRALRTVLKTVCPDLYGAGHNPAWCTPVDTSSLKSPCSLAIAGDSPQVKCSIHSLGARETTSYLSLDEEKEGCI